MWIFPLLNGIILYHQPLVFCTQYVFSSVCIDLRGSRSFLELHMVFASTTSPWFSHPAPLDEYLGGFQLSQLQTMQQGSLSPSQAARPVSGRQVSIGLPGGGGVCIYRWRGCCPLLPKVFPLCCGAPATCSQQPHRGSHFPGKWE